MYVIRARNVQEALPDAVHLMGIDGVKQESRNGPVLVMPEPVTTVYEKPCERVGFWPERDANPFFHLFESLWMLDGRDDVAYVQEFAKNMANYSDDGISFWGAYGARWRWWFLHDQIEWAIKRFKKDRTDRRVVISMWHGGADPEMADDNGKDVPCNLIIHFQIQRDALNMSVFNRSNDIVWGCYGANAVHMSMLQEYIANSLGIPVGTYHQISNNFHAYLDTFKKVEDLGDLEHFLLECPYQDRFVEPQQLFMSNKKAEFDADLKMFLEDETAIGYKTPFFRKVAVPMRRAHRAYKSDQSDRFHLALHHINSMPARNDWRLACEQWIQRRKGEADANQS